MVLRSYEHLEYAEIAALTGVREGSVRSASRAGWPRSGPSWGRTVMPDLEERLGRAPTEHAEEAPTPAGLADGARSRLRSRRRVAVGAAVAAAAAPVALLGAGRPAEPTGPQEQVDAWRTVTVERVSFDVPRERVELDAAACRDEGGPAYGPAGTDPCGDGTARISTAADVESSAEPGIAPGATATPWPGRRRGTWPASTTRSLAE